jgi:hypothetical protein
MNPSFHTYITLRMSFIAFDCGMPRGSSQPLEFRHSNWAGEAQEFCVNIPFRLYNEREKRNMLMGVHRRVHEIDLDPRGEGETHSTCPKREVNIEKKPWLAKEAGEGE